MISKKTEKSEKDIKVQIQEKYGNEFSIIGEYKGEINEIVLKHNLCGKTFTTNPEAFLKKGVCPHCYSPRYNREKTDAQFREEVKNKFGDNFEILSPYVNSRTKIKIKCKKCGAIKDILPYPFIHSFHCSCTPKQKTKIKLKRTTEEFKKEVYDLVGDEYTVLGEYEGANVKTLMRHNCCGRTFELEPVRFLNNHVRCLPCNRNYTKTNDEFKAQVYTLVGDDFIVLDDYKNAKTKLRIQCNSCNHVHEYIPRNFMTIKKCPYCGHKKNSI